MKLFSWLMVIALTIFLSWVFDASKAEGLLIFFGVEWFYARMHAAQLIRDYEENQNGDDT